MTGMTDHSGYNMYTYVCLSCSIFKTYALTANVSTYVKYVNTFAC